MQACSHLWEKYFYYSEKLVVPNLWPSVYNGSVTFYVSVFLSPSLSIFLQNLTGYMSNTAVSYKKAGTAFPSPAHEFTPDFWGCVFLTFYVLVLSYYVSLRSEFVLWCPSRFPHDNALSKPRTAPTLALADSDMIDDDLSFLFYKWTCQWQLKIMKDVDV
jgi:hypothetical protein